MPCSQILFLIKEYSKNCILKYSMITNMMHICKYETVFWIRWKWSWVSLKYIQKKSLFSKLYMHFWWFLMYSNETLERVRGLLWNEHPEVSSSCLLKMLLQRLVQLCCKCAVVWFELNVSKFEHSSFQGRLHKKVIAYVLVYLINKVLKFCHTKCKCCNFQALFSA